MSEVMDKIYCMPDNNNCAEVMAMMNNNNWMNNPFMYLIWLAFFGNNGFGNGRFGDNAGQIAQLQDSVNTNHNNDLAMQAIQGNGAALHELAGNLNVGVSALSGAITGIRGAIDLVGANNNLGSERVINSILLGNKDLTQQLAQCCCDNKYETATQFAQLNYNLADQSCQTRRTVEDATRDLLANQDANTRAILDFMTQDKIAGLQAENAALKSAANNAAQTWEIVNQLRPCPTPAYVVPNPYCNCGTVYGTC